MAARMSASKGPSRARSKNVTLPDTFGGLTLDGWANFISGLGEAKFDKRLSNRIVCCPVQAVEARVIYQGSDMGARLVEARVKEMWRPGFTITVKDLKGAASEPSDKLNLPITTGMAPAPGSVITDGKRSKASRRMARRMRMDAATDQLKTLATRATRKWRRLKGKKRFREAQHYANAYGAGAVLLGVRDGAKTLAEPLVPEKVQGVEFLLSFEAEEFTPIAWYEEIGEKFGEPRLYQITPRSQSGVAIPLTYVHESRLIVFEGVRIGRVMSGTQSWLGDSCFTRVKQILSDFDMGFASIGILLQEISIACMKIKGLAEAASNDAGRKKIFARMAAVAMAKSIANLTLIDADGEEFTRTNATVSGIADLLQCLMQRVAAAFDMPVTVLMGMSPAGLNATGASDIRQWYDDIAAERDDRIDEPVHQVMSLILRTLNGGIEPADWCVEWGPLYQMDPKEQAEIFLTYANADEKNVMNGFYTADEVRKSRYATAKFGEQIVISTEGESDEYTDEELADYTNATKSAPSTDPAAVPSGGKLAGAPDIQKQAMTGVQVTALIEVIKAVGAKEISRESGLAALKLAFQIDDPTANDLLGPDTFKPVTPEPPPSPFGGAPGGPPEKDKPGVDKIPPSANKGQPEVK